MELTNTFASVVIKKVLAHKSNDSSLSKYTGSKNEK